MNISLVSVTTGGRDEMALYLGAHVICYAQYKDRHETSVIETVATNLAKALKKEIVHYDFEMEHDKWEWQELSNKLTNENSEKTLNNLSSEKPNS